MSSLRFTEEMDGFLAFDADEADYERGLRHGERAGTNAMFHLTIDVDDDDAFLDDPQHRASARGWVRLGPFGDTPLPVADGVFNLFPENGDKRRQRMVYTLPFTAPDGQAMELYGEKHVADDEGFDVWDDTTTLFAELREAGGGPRLAIGILRLTLGDFLRQLTTFRGDGADAFAGFGGLFVQKLWQVYGGHTLPAGVERREAASRETPVPLVERVVPYTSADGFVGKLVNVRAAGVAPTLGPIYMAAGSSVRTNVFRAPISENIVERLVREGYDVWLNEWRASFERPRSEWTLDEGGVLDHPEAVRTVVRETGAEKVKALVHCQGSSSFFIGLVSGLMPQVDTVVSNAMSLHPVVPFGSKVKIVGLTPILARFGPYVDIGWGVRPQGWLSRIIRRYVNATHHECDNLVCKISSFFYGIGPSTMWDHAKLSPTTHDWLTDEFEWIPMRFFKQMRRSVMKGHLVCEQSWDGVPEDLCAQPPKTDAKITFLQGTNNRCFAPVSQERSYEWFVAHGSGEYRLRQLRGYGHFDCWMGEDAPVDVFPVVLDALAG
ncbi:MAG: hypothetical protein JHC95_01055 [Solirubrobacteraceae bacterium]|nr:hypothetical protein [Solirubrobacteraceae bacterium]